ncbi:hypothetical protein BS17DRAFT_770859 [Gyrodon lividus]|nr:hypothetical protein BS17DRAFT_770859 [Gyrodon lividus]
MSSPTRSEGKHSESDSPGSSNPFGGPNSHGTKTIKYRYSATGKHRSSPLKGSSSSPERKIINTSKPRVKPKAKPLPAFTPSASTSASKGKAPAMPSTPRKRKASVSSFRREDTPSSLSALSPLSSVPTSPIVPTKDLPPSSTPMTKWTTPDPSTRLPRIKTISTSSSWPYVSKVSTLSQPLSSPRTKKANMAIGNRGPNTWDVGSSVWILVNESGTLVDDSVQPNNDPDLFEERLWWPAQIVQKQPLRGSLFGDFPSSSSSTRGLCTILVPSPANIQSIYDDTGSKRFTCTTFRIPSSSPADGLISSPPKKKQRLDPSVSTSLEDRWKSAVQSMEKASTLERDGLPALISSYASAGASFYDSLDDSDPDTSDFRQSLRKPTKSTGVVSNTPKSTESPRMLKSQRLKANLKSSNLKGDTTASTTRDWSLCPPDPTLQIPGELVLAQAPKTGASYWPAQLIEHVPGRKERYKVKFLDDEKYVIGRDRFWTSEEEGFVCCTLGQWESAVKTIDDSESGDEGADYDDDDSGDVKDPPPPPPPAEDFEDLSVRAQLAYVKPILQAILNKEYVPAREKHEGFMKGGSARAALLKAAGVRGGMDARFVKAMQRAICQWVLGEDGGRSVRMDAEDVAVDAGREAANTNTVMDGATLKVDPSESAPVESLGEKSMENGMMEGIGGGVGSETTQADSQDGAINESLHPITPLSEIGMEDYEMAVDKPEQPHEAPLPKMSSVDPGPASVKQAPSELKGQLDVWDAIVALGI